MLEQHDNLGLAPCLVQEQSCVARSSLEYYRHTDRRDWFPSAGEHSIRRAAAPWSLQNEQPLRRVCVFGGWSSGFIQLILLLCTGRQRIVVLLPFLHCYLQTFGARVSLALAIPAGWGATTDTHYRHDLPTKLGVRVRFGTSSRYADCANEASTAQPRRPVVGQRLRVLFGSIALPQEAAGLWSNPPQILC